MDSTQAPEFTWMDDVEKRWLHANPFGFGRQMPDYLCRHFLEVAEQHLRFCSATIWSVNSVAQRLVLIAARGIEEHDIESRVRELPLPACLCGKAVDGQDVTQCENVNAPRTDGRIFHGPKALRTRGHGMQSVPIFNAANPHQVILVVNFILKPLLWTA